MNMASQSRIAVAIGDPNGIGPEIAVKAAARFAGTDLRPVLVGDAYIIEHYARRHATGLPLAPLGREKPAGLVYVDVNALDETDFHPGQLLPATGRATVAYASRAVRLSLDGQVDAVVGCPHSETAINAAGIEFSGYPGLIAQLTNTPRDEVFLMLVAAGLHIAHVTLHESVRDALQRLTPELVVNAALAAVKAEQRLGNERPALAVFGINPHAGEDGLFGDDDARITEPAVAQLRKLGLNVDGPTGADLLLGQRKHDVYLAMFHDQGHIPIKLLSPLRSSALTIGTPILFSSVGHGCAADIAGQGVADPISVIETLALLHNAKKS
ncbi:4-hydroxythreonine-4-phosphate dehydrogenase PdxA [Eoetvoesia caeni]|uniref:4-hydroxythreonine-4-phosphate dehydrogenase n=2 Tax=Eoetvoesiella caeni TaxID=645616 RepID=A0A366HGN5_9BURK|nr:4-hydroxythreonine-4-phosphate dehydrogenase PdxA [Eoetvoesiella caeni]MCI2807887.1 4-hydroxythreonine-4-phosphate dehydrogenase PdxA [Eoetvoesiella caeni]NYT54111.1 4-hydroxythreonine-4-phosphate dehydrogenase PdxA [Eoetvoesiella caeni]RBP41804.1 4-hydroxythreonine-4-phosphate dehydrogenase [Eoetvoesiella caeni]